MSPVRDKHIEAMLTRIGWRGHASGFRVDLRTPLREGESPPITPELLTRLISAGRCNILDTQMNILDFVRHRATSACEAAHWTDTQADPATIARLMLDDIRRRASQDPQGPVRDRLYNLLGEWGCNRRPDHQQEDEVQRHFTTKHNLDQFANQVMTLNLEASHFMDKLYANTLLAQDLADELSHIHI